MTRPQTESWSIWRALALMAATFAIVLGTLLPYAAMAASGPGWTLVLCSAEGQQTLRVDADGNPDRSVPPPKCAACVMAPAAVLPTPPAPRPCPAPTVTPATTFTALIASPPPPARAPPRPPSTAPPHA
ncbi:MAG: hypothetical protein REJ23_08195 [Brevundimonas sp.]|nr:hypothetical protein [Brevundimonas sp.]